MGYASAGPYRSTSRRARRPGDAPNVARVHNSFLGGKDAYGIDLAAVAHLRQVTPMLEAGARVSRAFMHRAVPVLAAAGVEQFIDIGSGYPTTLNVHDVSQQVNPDSRVLYTDVDTGVLVHSHALLGGCRGVGVAFADARDVHELLTHPVSRRLIDLRRPVGVLAVHVLEFLDDPGAERLLDMLASALPPGSCVAVTQTAPDMLAAETERELHAGASEYTRLVAPFRVRSSDCTRRMLSRFEVVPGETGRADTWSLGHEPDEASASAAETAPVFAAIARLPEVSGGDADTAT